MDQQSHTPALRLIEDMHKERARLGSKLLSVDAFRSTKERSVAAMRFKELTRLLNQAYLAKKGL
jgi:hypothetical protein